MKPTLDSQADKLTSYARHFAETGVGLTAEDYFQSEVTAAEIGVAFNRIMQGYDVLIAPTTALPAVAAEFDEAVEYAGINGRVTDRFLSWVMTVPFNMMSTHPVISVPSGQAGNGVPTGIQIIGRPFHDEAVFQAAFAYEDACGGWYRDASARPAI